MTFIDQLDQLDRSLFLILNSWNMDWLDPIMWYISQPWIWVPVYGLFVFLTYKTYGLKGIIWILIGIGLVVTLADNIHRELFKEVFERLRPSRNPELEGLVHLVKKPSGDLYTGGRFGFVSGHAANFFGIATFLVLFLKTNRITSFFIVFWAALIAYSRIYLGVHYPGDILGGMLLGVAIGITSAFIVKKVTKGRLPLAVNR